MKPDLPSSTPCALAFVVGAPGDREMHEGRPLVGAGGNVFNQLLRVANIDRRACFITHVFDEQPPGDDCAPWIRDAERAEAALARLAGELDAAAPRLIVALGATAAWALTGLNAINPLRGAVALATRVAPGVKMMATYDPEHVRRQWKFFAVVVTDLIKAAREAEIEGLNYTEREIWVEPTLADLAAFAETHLSKSALLSVDIETMPSTQQITCIGFAPDVTRALVVPFVDWRKPSRSYWPSAEDELAAWSWVETQLRSPTPKLMQNGTYDAYWLWDRMGIPTLNYCEDTRLLHHALQPELPKDLAFMGASYASAGAWKTMRKGQGDKKDD